MAGEAPEEHRCPRLAADSSAHAGGVVEHEARRHAAHIGEDVEQSLAYTLGVLSVEHLRELDVGEGEAGDEVVNALLLPVDDEVGFAEVDLDLPGAQTSFRYWSLAVLRSSRRFLA